MAVVQSDSAYALEGTGCLRPVRTTVNPQRYADKTMAPFEIESSTGVVLSLRGGAEYCQPSPTSRDMDIKLFQERVVYAESKSKKVPSRAAERTFA